MTRYAYALHSLSAAHRCVYRTYIGRKPKKNKTHSERYNIFLWAFFFFRFVVFKWYVGIVVSAASFKWIFSVRSRCDSRECAPAKVCIGPWAVSVRWRTKNGRGFCKDGRRGGERRKEEGRKKRYTTAWCMGSREWNVLTINTTS